MGVRNRRKITVLHPERSIEQASEVTAKVITQTILRGLANGIAANACLAAFAVCAGIVKLPIEFDASVFDVGPLVVKQVALAVGRGPEPEGSAQGSDGGAHHGFVEVVAELGSFVEDEHERESGRGWWRDVADAYDA